MKTSVNKENIEQVLKVEGIYSNGYGMIGKNPLQDKRLGGSAKLIYSYFCTFTGAGSQAFPSVNKILKDLNLSINTYYKYLNQLKQYGYVSIEQQTDKSGRFSRNVFTLNMFPESKAQEPPKKKKSTSLKNVKSKKQDDIVKKFEETMKELAENINVEELVELGHEEKEVDKILGIMAVACSADDKDTIHRSLGIPQDELTKKLKQLTTGEIDAVLQRVKNVQCINGGISNYTKYILKSLYTQPILVGNIAVDKNGKKINYSDDFIQKNRKKVAVFK